MRILNGTKPSLAKTVILLFVSQTPDTCLPNDT